MEEISAGSLDNILSQLIARFEQLKKEVEPYKTIDYYCKAIMQMEELLQMYKTTYGPDGDLALFFAKIDKQPPLRENDTKEKCLPQEKTTTQRNPHPQKIMDMMMIVAGEADDESSSRRRSNKNDGGKRKSSHRRRHQHHPEQQNNNKKDRRA